MIVFLLNNEQFYIRLLAGICIDFDSIINHYFIVIIYGIYFSFGGQLDDICDDCGQNSSTKRLIPQMKINSKLFY